MPTSRTPTGRATLLVAGLFVVWVGFYVVLTAVLGAWPTALVGTLALGAVAWFVKPDPGLRVLRWLFALFAAACAVGLVVDLIVGHG